MTIPRRCRIDLYTPAETAIAQAMEAVEAAGCHPTLTEAVILLGRAKDRVADFVDGEFWCDECRNLRFVSGEPCTMCREIEPDSVKGDVLRDVS